MDWTEKQECVLCNRGGKLLVCNGDGCPISVHKNCMGCEAHLDDAGNFHCPYCLYRQLTAETCRLREKAMLAKKALSTFLEEEMRDGNHQEPIVGMANKEERISSKDKICLVDGDNLVCDDVQDQCVHFLEEEMRDGNHQEPIVGMANKEKQISSEDKICLVNGDNLVCDNVQDQSVHFLEEEMRDGNHQEPIVGMANKEKQISSEDKICLVDGDNLVCDNVQDQCVHLEKHQSSKTPLPCEETHETFVPEQTDGFNRPKEVPELSNVNSCTAMVVYKKNSNLVDACGFDKRDRMKADQLESDVSKRMKVDNQTGKAKCKFDGVVDNQQHATSIAEAAQSKDAVISSSIKKQIAYQKRNRLVSFNKNGNRSEEECIMECAAETLVFLSTGVELQSKSNSKNDKDNSDSNIFLKDRQHTRHGPAHLLDHPNGATKGSLEAMTGVVSCTDIKNISNPGELKDSCKQLSLIDSCINLPLQNGKHRVRWSEEEEDMLKEGVQKFSQLMRKSVPWKKILEFGHHVFDASRTPSDLKDKWRNMAK